MLKRNNSNPRSQVHDGNMKAVSSYCKCYLLICTLNILSLGPKGRNKNHVARAWLSSSLNFEFLGKVNKNDGRKKLNFTRYLYLLARRHQDLKSFDCVVLGANLGDRARSLHERMRGWETPG